MSNISVKRSYIAQAPMALIIGCGDMGMGCARALGRRHPLVIVDIDAERLETCANSLRLEGYSVEAHACDIAARDQVAKLGERLANGPGIKVLAHVAAIGNNGAGWRRVLEVDLVAARLVADMASPHLVTGGVAVLISSTGAQRCPRDARLDALLDDPLRPDLLEAVEALAGRELNFLDAYFMAKRGVNRMAERLAIEWGPREIRCLTVSPGLVESTMGRTGGAQIPIYHPSGDTRLGTRDEKALVEVPLQRQGTVLEVIAAVDFLASDAASFINGIDVAVDGGSGAFWRATATPSQSLAIEQVAPGYPASS